MDERRGLPSHAAPHPSPPNLFSYGMINEGAGHGMDSMALAALYSNPGAMAEMAQFTPMQLQQLLHQQMASLAVRVFNSLATIVKLSKIALSQGQGLIDLKIEEV